MNFRNLSGDLKKATDIGKNKFAETRGKFQSQPSKNLDLDARNKAPPPPPPARSSTNHERSSSVTSRPSFSAPPPPQRQPPTTNPPPPPPRPSGGPVPVASRAVQPDAETSSNPSRPSFSALNHKERGPAIPKAPASSSSPLQIDWSNLTQGDKEAFFSLLDEYFQSRRGLFPSGPHEPIAPQPQGRLEEPSAAPDPVPPPLPTWSRPKHTAGLDTSAEDNTSNFVLSYPPATQYGCGGLDLAYYFSTETHWEEAWYNSASFTPPFLKSQATAGTMSGWEAHGARKTVFGGAMYPDLSMCWYTVTFSTASNADPNDSRSVVRSARYLLPPQPMASPALVEAHQTYGETIAGFAESYEGTGEYCGRGECWDLASEALKYFDQFDYVPKPLPSTSCTHGHLIFSGRASSASQQIGQWRGGDDRIRRGDIVQWKSAKVTMDNGGQATIGMPDHTAVIVAEAVPNEQVGDGKLVSPAAIGVIEVVEQSVGSPAKRERYNLSRMTTGEIWIYRPVGIVEYLGTELAAKCPDNVDALSV